MSSVIQYRLIFIDYEKTNGYNGTIVKIFQKFDDAVKDAIGQMEKYYAYKRVTKQGLTNRIDKLIGRLHNAGCYVDTDKGVIQLVVTILQEDLR